MLLHCPQCNDSLSSLDNLNTHLWNNHRTSILPDETGLSSDDKIACPGCEIPIRSDSLVYHLPCLDDITEIDSSTLEWFGYEGVLCPLCGVNNKSEYQFESHVTSSHSEDEFFDFITSSDTDCCIGCGESRESSDNHARHYLNQHAAFGNTPPGTGFRCLIEKCDVQAGSQDLIQYHFWSEHFEGSDGFDENRVCPGCGEEVSLENTVTHFQCLDSVDPSKLLEYFSLPLDLTDCFICDYSSYNRGKLAVHIQNDHVPSLLEEGCCPTCDDDLTDASRSDLFAHYPCFAAAVGETVPLESNTSGLVCPDCSEPMESVEALTKHVNNEHLGLIFRDSVCEYCNNSITHVYDHIDCLVGITGNSISNNRLATHAAVDSLGADERADYYQDLQEFIELEREATREEGWERYHAQSAQELAQSNRAIPEVTSIGEQYHPEFDDQYVYEQLVPDYVNYPNNLVDQFGIYPGSEIIIDVDRETDALPTEAIVTFVDQQTIGIGLKDDYDYHSEIDREMSHLDSSQEMPTYSIYKLLNPTTYDRKEEAVDRAQRSDLIDGIVTGGREITEKQAKVASLIDPSLNTPQQRAVNRALSTSDITCIHGPPGTGKTRTLTALIKAAVTRGDDVLAVAHSNQAVDNLIVGTSSIDGPDKDSLHFAAKQDEFDIARIGQNSRNDVIQKYHSDTRPNGAQVVAGTMSASADLSRTFDWVIVDEATQAAQPATLISLLRGNKIVLAGDHKQLPPFASSEDAKREEMHISLFEHILDRYSQEFAERLLTQYRMNKHIAQFPSDQFYEGSLDHGDLNEDWTIAGLEPLNGIHVEGSEQTDPNSKSKYNIAEAQIVAEQAKNLLDKGLNPDEIGVITSYSAQIGKISGELHNVDIDEPSRIEVDTIDSFQGSERKAIIVSFVRSNDRNNAGFLEFPEEGPRRLNVALTRAQKRLVLVGDFDTLGNVADHRDVTDSCAHIYDELMNYCSSLGYVKSV